MEIFDDDGDLVRATFHVEFLDGAPTVVFESCGGKPRRNPDYNKGLQLVLQRLGLGGATLLNIDVDSIESRKISEELRKVIIDEAAYPIDLGRWADFLQLRVGIGRGAARVAKAPGSSSSGNTQKQLRMYLRFPRPTRATERWLRKLISQCPDVTVEANQIAGAKDRPSISRSGVSYARVAAGQGRSTDNARNRAVERFAMDAATAYFASEQGGRWDVSDVTAKYEGYDLLCTRGAEKLRVEVKGTTGAGLSVILTRNEVDQAHQNSACSVLFVKLMIDVAQRDGEWVCSGGEDRILRQWDPRAQGQLQIEQYKYTLPPWSDE